MLIDIISEIFLKNSFQALAIEHDFSDFEIRVFAPLPNQSKSDFFIVIDSHAPTADKIDELCNTWADELHLQLRRDKNLDRSFAKNSTMIICWEEQSITQSQILKIEEDRYNFKKNVIIYNDNDVNSLQAQNCNFDNESINKLINNDNGNDFINFKEGVPQAKDYYSLLMKIVMKIPFITYLPVDMKLKSLDDNLLTGLSNKDKETFNLSMEIDESLSDEEFMNFFLSEK